jgi:hypothetical protein
VQLNEGSRLGPSEVISAGRVQRLVTLLVSIALASAGPIDASTSAPLYADDTPPIHSNLQDTAIADQFFDQFGISKSSEAVSLRYSETRRVTRVILELANGDHPNRLLVPVLHLHQFGFCRGALVITSDRMVFSPETGSDGFDLARGAYTLKHNAKYELGPTLEVTPMHRHRLRLQIDCRIRESYDTTGPMRTCRSVQAPVMSMAEQALNDFDGMTAAILRTADNR